jgi:hypothetical protein
MKIDSTRSLCFGIAALICIMNVIPMIEAQGVRTIPADSFAESIGVTTHWWYSNVYMYNYTDLKAKLGEAGIRYIIKELPKKSTIFIKVWELKQIW